MKKKEYILNLIYSILPMVLIFPLSIWGLFQMEKASYDSFFVKGPSMSPTLCGDSTNSTYGRYDSSKRAIDKLERFDLIVCYFPFENSKDYNMPYVRNSEKLNSATLKVKRVIGLPHDRLVIDNNIFTIFHTINGKEVAETYGADNLEVPFQRKEPIEDRKAAISLGEDEYFVMGDNWTKKGSSDCCNPPNGGPAKCIYKENIEGVIFRLDGICAYAKIICNSCGLENDKDSKVCKCGSTSFTTTPTDDIVKEYPFEDGPIYLK